MKLIFLDIDGVLNGHDWNDEAASCTIRRECVAHLNTIIRATSAMIVISSAWRYMILCEAMTTLGFGYMLRSHGMLGTKRIIGTTRKDRETVAPNTPDGMFAVDQSDTRGDQIAEWLSGYDGEHGQIESYVVLDDEDYDIGRQHPLVKTDGCCGLTPADASKAIAILNQSQEPRP